MSFDCCCGRGFSLIAIYFSRRVAGFFLEMRWAKLSNLDEVFQVTHLYYLVSQLDEQQIRDPMVFLSKLHTNRVLSSSFKKKLCILGFSSWDRGTW